SLYIGKREALSAQGLSKSESPAPFLSRAHAYSLPARPDFLAVGDFVGDGHLDVMAAESGRQALYLLRGDGRGALAQAKTIELPGEVTAMTALRFASAEPSAIVAGIVGTDGPRLLFYRDGQSMTYPLGDEASSVAAGSVADDGVPEVAVGVGRQVL